MDTVTAQLVFGIIVIVIAIVLIYWINRRKFYRRNGMGAEDFRVLKHLYLPVL